jgi:hypothetical protein
VSDIVDDGCNLCEQQDDVEPPRRGIPEMRKSLLIIISSLFFGASLAQGSPTPLTFQFFPTSSSGDANLGLMHTFSDNGVNIVASGFYSSGASDLYYKNDGTSPSEQGLGLNSDPTGDHEINDYYNSDGDHGFVQLNVSNVWALNPLTFSMTFSSTTIGE